MADIFFFTEEIDFELPNQQTHSSWIDQAIQQEAYHLEGLNYIFCSDDYLLGVNQEYLNHDYYTDIITFDNSQEETTVEGDLFISIDRVRDNASQMGKDFNEELRRVMIHGVLHLMGYKDKTEAEERTMREKENAYLSLPQFIF